MEQQADLVVVKIAQRVKRVYVKTEKWYASNEYRHEVPLTERQEHEEEDALGEQPEDDALRCCRSLACQVILQAVADAKRTWGSQAEDAMKFLLGAYSEDLTFWCGMARVDVSVVREYAVRMNYHNVTKVMVAPQVKIMGAVVDSGRQWRGGKMRMLGRAQA